MQEKESIMVVRCVLKIPSLGKTVRHHSGSLVTLVTGFLIRISQPLKNFIEPNSLLYDETRIE